MLWDYAILNMIYLFTAVLQQQDDMNIALPNITV